MSNRSDPTSADRSQARATFDGGDEGGHVEGCRVRRRTGKRQARVRHVPVNDVVMTGSDVITVVLSCR